MPADEFDGQAVELTNLDKVLYTADGTTKREVIDYYAAIAPAMLPHIHDRPVTRKRWPNGVGETAFFEKNLAKHAPAWIERRGIAHKDRVIDYPLISSVAGMAWLGQQAALEVHVPQWRFVPDTGAQGEAGSVPGDPAGARRDPVGPPQRYLVGPPTRLVFDLDPGDGVGLAECATIAVAIRDIVASVGLRAYPVTSGSKGIHIYVPLESSLDAGGASAVAKQVAENLEKLYPQLVTSVMAKAARTGRVFLDWSQNNAAKTTIAPYSLRGREHPMAAAPREWSELTASGTLTQLRYDEVLARYLRDGDLLAGLDLIPGAAATSPRPGARADSATISLPHFSPMLATAGEIARLDPQLWAFEPKWDGFRVIVEVSGGTLRVRSRSGLDVTERYPQFAQIADDLAAHSVILDGEAVALDDDGRQSFERVSRSGRDAHLYAFDVLHVDGTDLTGKKYEDRRLILQALAGASDAVRLTDQVSGDGAEAMALSAERGWEGIIAKRRDSLYYPGRRFDGWIKAKHWRELDVVVGGWRRGQGGRSAAIGSLLIGVPGPDGLRFAGRVGTGFSDQALRHLRALLEPLARADSPFNAPIEPAVARDALWVEPVVAGRVKYRELTDSGQLRHPVWLGLAR